MSTLTADTIRLRQAAQHCHALAAESDDGFGALSYAQLADEIDTMVAVRETPTAIRDDATGQRWLKSVYRNWGQIAHTLSAVGAA
jgi:hypothetical protein